MINRWQGNSGRVQRLPEQGDRIQKPQQEPGHVTPGPRPQAPLLHKTAQRRKSSLFSSLEGLSRLLPGKAEELETEDIILLLILYLMYRESGDSELLMIMGAMFLL